MKIKAENVEMKMLFTGLGRGYRAPARQLGRAGSGSVGPRKPLPRLTEAAVLYALRIGIKSSLTCVKMEKIKRAVWEIIDFTGRGRSSAAAERRERPAKKTASAVAYFSKGYRWIFMKTFFLNIGPIPSRNIGRT